MAWRDDEYHPHAPPRVVEHVAGDRAHVEGAIRKCYEHAITELLEHVEPEQI